FCAVSASSAPAAKASHCTTRSKAKLRATFLARLRAAFVDPTQIQRGKIMFNNPPTMSPQEISGALSRGEIVLIDVREPMEFAAERIHGALLYPLSTFDPADLPH